VIKRDARSRLKEVCRMCTPRAEALTTWEWKQKHNKNPDPTAPNTMSN